MFFKIKFRVVFIKESISCLNDYQTIYIDENNKILAELTSVQCVSNLTQSGIRYQLLTKTSNFQFILLI